MRRSSFTVGSFIVTFGILLADAPPVTQGQVCSIHEIQKLIASDAAAEDRLGGSVSISGDHAIIGATGDADAGDNCGAAYVFRRDDNGTPLDPNDDFWIAEAKLTASDAHSMQVFGRSVSISGAWAIVGASGDDHVGVMSGSAYMFHRDDSGTPVDPSDDSWVEVQKLTASDAAALDEFGRTVSLGGGWAIIGVPSDGDEPALHQLVPDDRGGAR